MEEKNFTDQELKKAKVKTILLKIHSNLDILIQRKRNDIFNKEREFLEIMKNPNICYDTRKAKISLMLMDIYKKNAMSELIILNKQLMGHENILSEKSPINDNYINQLHVQIYSLIYSSHFINVPGLKEFRDQLLENGNINRDVNLYDNNHIDPTLKFYFKESLPSDQEIEDYLGYLFNKFKNVLPAEAINQKNVISQSNQLPQNTIINKPAEIPLNYQVSSNKNENHSNKNVPANDIHYNHSQPQNEFEINKQSKNIQIQNEDERILNESVQNFSVQDLPSELFKKPNKDLDIIYEHSGESKYGESNEDERNIIDSKNKGKGFPDLTINSKVYFISKMAQKLDEKNNFNKRNNSDSTINIPEKNDEEDESGVNWISSDDYEPSLHNSIKFNKNQGKNEFMMSESVDLLEIENQKKSLNEGKPLETLSPFIDMLELSKNISFKNENTIKVGGADISNDNKLSKIFENEDFELYIVKKK